MKYVRMKDMPIVVLANLGICKNTICLYAATVAGLS